MAEYSTGSPRAVTGGVVVRDPGLPTLVGRYLYADYYDGVVRSLALGLPRATDDRPAGLATVPNLGAFGEDACGHVYVVSNNGTVSRVQDGALGPCVRGFAGTTAAPPPAGGSTGTPGPPDRTSPRISIRVARKGRVGRRATPRILITASENCRVTITARLAKTNLKRVRTPLRGGRRTVVRLRPKARAIKKIRRALRRHKRVTMTVKRDRGRRGRQHRPPDEAAEAAPGLGLLGRVVLFLTDHGGVGRGVGVARAAGDRLALVLVGVVDLVAVDRHRAVFVVAQ